MRVILLRVPSLAVAAASLAALVLLGKFRPEWPPLPGSLSSPVTTTFLEQLVLVTAWFLAALVFLLLLIQSLREMRANRHRDLVHPDLPARTRQSSSFRMPANKQGLLRPLIVEPMLLVVAPREGVTAPPEEHGAGSSSKPALSDDASEHDTCPRISLLGPLAIHGGKRSRTGLRARALELIAYLALRREGAQRDEILEALWPGEDPNRSRHRLYQAVRDARRLLGEAVASERDRYWLDRTRVRVDIDELEQLLESARQAGADEERSEVFERALSIFRAEPLSGCDFVWSETDLRSLRGTYVELLERVGRARLERGDAREALAAAERGLAVDLLNEALWRLGLAAESELGLREAIKDRYSRLGALLDEKLGLEPSSQTRSLYLRLLSQT